MRFGVNFNTKRYTMTDNTRISRAKRSTHPPIVIKDLGSIFQNEYTSLRFRVIKYQHPYIGESVPMLDIRQYFIDKPNEEGSPYTGWSSNGISLKMDEIKETIEFISEGEETLDALSGHK